MKRVPVLAAATVLSFAVGGCTTSASRAVEHHSTTSTASSHRPNSLVDAEVTPSGWVPVELGDAQISVPSGWNAGYNTCPIAEQPGSVFISTADYKMSCSSRPGVQRVPAVYLAPAPTSLGLSAISRKTVNGIVVLETSHSPAESSYVVPSLGVSVGLAGSAQRVLATLTHSPRAVVLSGAPDPAVPPSWQGYSFAGLRFAAPSTWPGQVTELYGPLCNIPGIESLQSVMLSTDTERALPACPDEIVPYRVEPPVDGVRVDAVAALAVPTPSGPAAHCFEIRGLAACPYANPAFGVLYLRVTGPRISHAVMFEVGLAGSGSTARTILGSLRPA